MKKVFIFLIVAIFISVLSSIVTAGIIIRHNNTQVLSAQDSVTPTPIDPYRKYFRNKRNTSSAPATEDNANQSDTSWYQDYLELRQQNQALQQLDQQNQLRDYIDMKNDELQQNINLQFENQRMRDNILGN